MTHLDIIRAACIKANPEIEGKHLFEVGAFRCKFCKVERIVHDRKISNRIVDEGTGGSSQDVETTDYNMEGGPCPEHSSRPIRLVDVLLAIRAKFGEPSGDNHIALAGAEAEITGGNSVGWNLRLDDLTQQSEETITFLAELLK